MPIVAVGTLQLAFLDGMVRRHRRLRINIRMTRVAHTGFIYGHRQSRRPIDVSVLDVNNLLNTRVGMWVMAVGACNAVCRMCRRMPGHRGRAIVTLQTQIGARLRANLTVRIVASCAVEAHRTTDLVWVSEVLLVHHIGVAAVANMRCNGPHIV